MKEYVSVYDLQYGDRIEFSVDGGGVEGFRTTGIFTGRDGKFIVLNNSVRLLPYQIYSIVRI